MASVYRDPRSPYWMIRFRDQNGKPRTVTSKLTDRAGAQKMADTFEKAASGQHARDHIRAEFAKVIDEFYREKEVNVTVRQFAAQWIEEAKTLKSDSTYVVRERVLRHFCEFLGPRADRHIADVERRDVLGFRKTYIDQKKAASSVKTYATTIHTFLQEAVNLSYTLFNPAAKIEHYQKVDDDQPERRAFTVTELEAILEVASPEWRSIIRFGAYTGMRMCDIVKLTWAKIDQQQWTIRLKTQKTRTWITVPVAAPLRKHILSLPGSDLADAPLHPLAFAVLARKRSCFLSHQFGTILARAGLRISANRRKRVLKKLKEAGEKRLPRSDTSFHSLRHFAVSILKANGVPQSVVQDIIGHRSEAITRLYTHSGDEAQRQAMEVFPEL